MTYKSKPAFHLEKCALLPFHLFARYAQGEVFMSSTDGTAKDAKAQAKADKAYAKASRPWFKKKRFWAFGVIAIMAIASSMGGGGSDSSSSESSTEVEASAPAVEVTAEALISELEGNALAAKNNWEDQTVKITGTLSNIDASGDYFSLSGDNEFSFVNIQVFIDDSFVDTVSGFSKGQTVTVTGKITGVGEVLGYSVDAISIP
jgi:hypothetical protein